jgi:ribonuclease HI
MPYSLDPDIIQSTIVQLQNGTLRASTLSPADVTLKYNWKSITYTDGSLLKPKQGPAKTGAAIYRPDTIDGLHGTEIAIDPCGHGITNTINRCELVAIAVALEKRPQDEVIATDSAVAMSLIKHISSHPMKLVDHIHYPLLMTIRENIKTRTAPIHIMKIKSHTTVTGNEIADYLAKRATQYPDIRFETGNNPFQGEIWPQVRNSDGLEWTISNLHKDLLNHCHAIHHLGHSNTDSIYFCSWSNIQEATLRQESNRFLTDRSLTTSERKMTLQYRFGCLYTQKLAFRYGFSPSPYCLLCGQLDGGHHALSGCPEMHLPVTARHHNGGSIIAKATLQGRYGANVVALDLGKLSQYQETDTPQDSEDIPSQIHTTNAVNT